MDPKNSSEQASRLQRFSQNLPVLKQYEDLESMDASLRETLHRLAWAILRDWTLAADAVQETLVVMMEKWEEIEPANRPGWLVRAVQLTAHNLRRRERVRAADASCDLSQLSSSDLFPMDVLVRQENRRLMEQCINRLPAEQARILRMRIQENMTFEQIAQHLEIPLGTALSRMRLALHRMRSLLPNDFGTA